jgi:type IV pilus assembly protein PilE
LPKSGIVIKNGFSLVELMCVVIILGVLATFALGAYQGVVRTAYKVTMQHDLQEFVRMQEVYFTFNSRYCGQTGEYIQGGASPAGTLMIPGASFLPSEDVRIEIISGNGQSPAGPPCFKAKVSHVKLNVTYEYDFATRQRMERQD